MQTLPVLLLRPEHAAQVLSIGKRTLWEETKSGRIRAVRIGRSVRYLFSDLQEYAANLAAGHTVAERG